VLHAGFFLGPFFEPEDGGDMFHQNISWLSVDYTASYPRKQNSSEAELPYSESSQMLDQKERPNWGPRLWYQAGCLGCMHTLDPWRLGMEYCWSCDWQGKSGGGKKTTSPQASMPHCLQIMWCALSLNVGLCSEKPECNCLIYGMAQPSILAFKWRLDLRFQWQWKLWLWSLGYDVM
jgi:hypothetical protein